jgi:DNA-binding NarL/FixJ family response regulator/signal transduction histidine kinase
VLLPSSSKWARDPSTRAPARRADGTFVDVELIAAVVRASAGEIIGYLGIHRDVTERRLLEEERARHARQQELVADLGLRALASDDLPALMDDAVRLVAQVLDIDLIGIAQIIPTGELVLRAGVGWQPGMIGTMTGSSGAGSLVGYTLQAGEPVTSEDLLADARFTPSAGLTADGVVSAMTVVIAGRDEPFGALAALCRTPRTFSSDDVQFLQTVANVLSTAMERAESAQRLDEVREHERSRIARDLHDDVLQGLAHAVATAQSGSARQDDELVEVLQRLARQVRGAIYDLRLDRHPDQPFADELDQLVEVHRAMAHAGCDVVIEIAELPGDSFGRRGGEVLRIVGEALSNARRHAGATCIRVRVTSSGTFLVVEVSDDGRGFDPDDAAQEQSPQGLRGMRERADLLDGELEVRSDGTGSKVRLHVDLRPAPDPQITRVLLVEDHVAVRQALAAAFHHHPDIEVVGQAASLSEARELLEGVDVAVIDLGLPDGYGADLIDDLRRVSPRAQALVLSATLDRNQIAQAVALGAAGVLPKTTYLDEVVAAVRRVRSGETLLPLGEIMELVSLAGRQRELERDDRAAIAHLTPRERQILQALADGLNSQQVAHRLHISIRTARNHIARILAKLDVHSQIQAVLVGLRYGVVSVAGTAPAPPRAGGPDDQVGGRAA